MIAFTLATVPDAIGESEPACCRRCHGSRGTVARHFAFNRCSAILASCVSRAASVPRASSRKTLMASANRKGTFYFISLISRSFPFPPTKSLSNFRIGFFLAVTQTAGYNPHSFSTSLHSAPGAVGIEGHLAFAAFAQTSFRHYLHAGENDAAPSIALIPRVAHET
jgi:hypothetical protein